MRTLYAKNSNLARAMDGISAAEKSGAGEAKMTAWVGPPGTGKSTTAKRIAVQQAAVYVRATATMTPHWLLTELARQLDIAPPRKTEDLFGRIVAALARDPRLVIVDEAEHLLRDLRMIEAVRDISDFVEIVTVVIGTEELLSKIRRHGQISSRVAKVVTFAPATLDDVRSITDTLAEVKVADDLLTEIHAQTAGCVREVLNAIAAIERAAKLNQLAEIGLKDLEQKELVYRWEGRPPRGGSKNGKGKS